MQWVDAHLSQVPAPEFQNHKIRIINSAKDILRAIRILHRDGYNLGDFQHEPKSVPSLVWETIDRYGDEDVDDIPNFDKKIDDEDDDDQNGKRGRRRWPKESNRRRRRPEKVRKDN